MCLSQGLVRTSSRELSCPQFTGAPSSLSLHRQLSLIKYFFTKSVDSQNSRADRKAGCEPAYMLTLLMTKLMARWVGHRAG